MEQLCEAIRRAAGEGKNGMQAVSLSLYGEQGEYSPMVIRGATDDRVFFALRESPIKM
jgi:hypothetical protein